MKTLKSYVADRWIEGDSGFARLVDPCSETQVAQASTQGVKFEEALAHATQVGGPALRAMSIVQRAKMLIELSKHLHEQREALIDLSLENSGTTRKDAKFDIDGAIFTLAHYGHYGQKITTPYFLEGDGIQLGRTPRFWGQHIQVPLQGCAVHVNAFNFPAWGFAEKAARAWLAGMPVITKPATSTALVTEACVRILVEAEALPGGALSLLCGSTGNLLHLLGPQDVLAFTGSAETARKLRGIDNLLDSSTRVNVEADSLNAAVLGPDVEAGSELFDVFIQDVFREITQKTGQKCTAVRRVLVSSKMIDAVQTALSERLADVVVGNPRDRSVTMGPLATEQQLNDAVEGTAALAREAKIVFGTGQRIDGIANDGGKGYFFGPVLLRCDDPGRAETLHRREVFGPVATLMLYDGTAEQAAHLVGLSQGTLVTSVYSDDSKFLARYIELGGAVSGRLYLGATKVAGMLPGSGVAMPQLLHGGPGRAGGGEELGGPLGLSLYLQRVALMGERSILERITGPAESAAEATS